MDSLLRLIRHIANWVLRLFHNRESNDPHPRHHPQLAAGDNMSKWEPNSNSVVTEGIGTILLGIAIVLIVIILGVVLLILGHWVWSIGVGGGALILYFIIEWWTTRTKPDSWIARTTKQGHSDD